MKKAILWTVLDLVFLAIFNTVFFVAGGSEHPVSVWISYGFIHFAYLMILVTPFLTRKSSSAAVFGFSIYAISSSYFLIEFIVGIVFILIKSESYEAALIVQIIIAGIYVLLLISHLIANESSSDSIERHEDEVFFIKSASAKVKPLISRVSDKKTQKEIEKVYDAIHSSPTKSNSTVRSTESEIMNRISELEDAVAANNSQNIFTLCAEALTLVDERNSKLKLTY